METGKKVTLWFSKEQLDALTRIKELRGDIATSALVRELLDNHLKELEEREAILASVRR